VLNSGIPGAHGFGSDKNVSGIDLPETLPLDATHGRRHAPQANIAIVPTAALRARAMFAMERNEQYIAPVRECDDNSQICKRGRWRAEMGDDVCAAQQDMA